jgi:AcrR family transcriptional regulator
VATTAESARDRIQTAAVELLARRGVAGTTTQEIARRARCSQAAIYKHWPGKEELARELFDTAHRAFLEAMEREAARRQRPSERVLGALLGLVRYARSHPAEYAFLFQVFHSDYARWLVSHPKPRDVVQRELVRAMAAGEVSPGPAAAKTALLLGMAIRLAFFERQGLVEGGPEALEEALVQGAAAVLEG